MSLVADILAIVAVTFLVWFIFRSLREDFEQKKVIEKYIEDEPKIQELYQIIKPLFDDPNKKFTGKLKALNDMDLLKKITMKKGNKSYTINKEVVHLCLKDANGQYYDNNSLIYVLIHELAHMVNKSIGHDNSFQETNDELLEYATEMGIYDPNKPMVANYCEHTPEE